MGAALYQPNSAQKWHGSMLAFHEVLQRHDHNQRITECPELKGS